MRVTAVCTESRVLRHRAKTRSPVTLHSCMLAVGWTKLGERRQKRLACQYRGNMLGLATD